MSRESTPILSYAIIEFEMFMTSLERLGKQHKILKPWTDVGLHWATKYYDRMDDTDAYVVTMCKFLKSVCYCSATNLNLQFSILLYASRGSKMSGEPHTSGNRRILFWIS
jgi:hypothetical protein